MLLNILIALFIASRKWDTVAHMSVRNLVLQCRKLTSVKSPSTDILKTSNRCTPTYEGKVHPGTGHEDPEGEWGYSSTLFFLTSALYGSGWSTPRLYRFMPGKRPGTHYTGGWVGPRDGLNGCGKSRPHRDSIPGPSSP